MWLRPLLLRWRRGYNGWAAVLTSLLHGCPVGGILRHILNQIVSALVLIFGGGLSPRRSWHFRRLNRTGVGANHD